jgi:hypothetical protein
MEGIERVDTTHATWAKKLDRKTIETTIHPVFFAELTTAVIGKHPPAFEPYELVEVKVAFSRPQQEWVILATVSPGVWKAEKKEKSHTRAT